VFKIEVDLDGQKAIVDMPFHFTNRKTEVFWKYDLAPGKHSVKLKLLNPDKRTEIVLKDILVYNAKPARPTNKP
jgi:hypothetical protein